MEADLGALAQNNLSMWALFMQAGFIVKMVMLMLVAASVWSWTIIFEKFILLKKQRKEVKLFEALFWSGISLDEIYDKLVSLKKPLNPMSSIFVAGLKEWKRAGSSISDDNGGASLQQRLDRIMQITLDREIEKMEKRMTFLASTGAVSPFIGLFGTVWGIMSSFHSIGMTNNTSLAVVAPGIAEALFATALGLVAAIPAVIAYNKFNSDFSRFGRALENFAGEFATIMSRQLDHALASKSRKGS